MKLLRLFDALYASRSVTKTAEQLGQSQPTVSIWLGHLRRELQDPLFVRTPDGMLPTPKADRLIGEALAALRRLSAREAEFDPATAERRFRICMTDASHANLLPQILVAVRAEAPHACIAATRIDAQTAERLRAGESDLALGYVPQLGAGFYQQMLYWQDWVCLANSRHPRVSGALDMESYWAEGHVGITSGTGHQLLETALGRLGRQRRIVLELPGFLGLGAILSNSDLIATLPRQTGETTAKTYGLALYPCPFPIEPFPVTHHWHARYHRDAGNQWLRKVIAVLFLAG